MFGKRFELNEQTIPVIEEFGKHMPGGFFIYEASGEEKLLYANQAVIRLFGCDDLEDFKKLTGYTFRGMLHPDDYAEVSRSIIEQIKSSDDNLDYVEYRIIRKDGSICWVDDYGHYTETEAYGGVYYVFISDITKKREHQALSDALKAAEEANKAKTVFLSNMSHEIRTPMNAIIGMYSLALKKEGLDPETREYLEKIGASARHLLGLINDILDMSRIESGRLLLRQEVFSFRNMLEEINTMVMTQCSDRGLKYEYRVIGGVSDHYIGDDGKLKQVLINILSNAIKFTEAPGLISLTVERTNVYNDQSTLKFVIKDTGIGMDPSFIPRIFDTFTQEDGSRSNKYGSTGLGMAITKNIVELMSGTISVASEKGVGSEFTVVLTLKNSDSAGSSDSSINPADIKKRTELTDRRILLAEDIAINAEIMKKLLESRGAVTDHALNGRIVVDMFKEHDPGYYDAILMDVRMPEMDGLEAAEKIRALDRPDAGSIPIIAMTANAFDEDVQFSMQAGMNAHLSKPVEPDRLFRTLEELICGSQWGRFFLT